MTVIKMTSSPNVTGKETNNTPESAGKKKYISLFTDVVFIFCIFNALISAAAVYVAVKVYSEDMKLLQTDRRSVIMLSTPNIVAFVLNVHLLCNVGKVQRTRLIWSTIVTMIVTLAGMATTFVYLTFVGVDVEILWKIFSVIYSLIVMTVLLGLVCAGPGTDQEHNTGSSGFGDMNKLLVRNDERSKKSGLEII